MRSATIARNYAETLLALARKANDLDGWGGMVTELAEAIERDERLRHFLEAPQIAAEQKITVLHRALQDRMPRLLVRFIETVIRHRRQALIPEIAAEYRDLVDEAEGRLHARVTLAREPAAAERDAIAAELSRVYGKRVVPHVTINPGIVGGVVIRVGDVVMDGSVRRRLALLRSRMVAGATR